MAEERDTIVGIDLGTTNSVVAAWDPGARTARVLNDEGGYAVQPSVVSFHPKGNVLVGAEAKQRRVIDPKNTVYSAKRLIGRTFDSHEVTAARERMPYVIKEGQNNQPIVVTRAGEFAIPEISAVVLDHMRTIAEGSLGGEVSRAVVTVPANFTDSQRSATATAGAIAGLTVVRVLNEPTAAALAYGQQRQLDEIIAVYDFGGGTLDVSILKMSGSVFEVLATAGDSFLGGDDIDERLVEHMCGLFLEQERVDLRTNEIAMQRLRAVAEQVKIELSRRSRALIKVDEIAYGPGGQPLNLELELDRGQFLSRIADIVESTFPICREAVRMAGISPQQVHDVVLVGGTTKMPFVREQVTKFFGKMPRTDVNPDEAVAVGAALQAMSLERILKRRRPTTQSERTTAQGYAAAPPPTPPPQTERQASPGQFIDSMPGTSPGNQLARITQKGHAQEPPPPPGQRKTQMGAIPPPIPTARRKTLGPGDQDDFNQIPTDAPTAVRDQDSLDLEGPTEQHDLEGPTQQRDPARRAPDQPTALGLDLPPAAAAAAASLGGPSPGGFLAPESLSPERPSVPTEQPTPPATVIDITPHSLGIATIAGYCEGIIARNSKVPAQTKRVFSTSRDSQQMVRIRVCQGESRRLAENTILGDLVLDGLEPRPRGETRIEVTFHIDASGILHVRARDRQTGQEQRANLELQGAQSPEEIAAAQDRFQQLRR